MSTFRGNCQWRFCARGSPALWYARPTQKATAELAQEVEDKAGPPLFRGQLELRGLFKPRARSNSLNDARR